MAGEVSGGACAGGHAACKRCNKNVVTGLKCYKCDNMYHVSCSKLANNVKQTNGGDIICCETQNDCITNEDDEVPFLDTIDETANEEKLVDAKVFKYIIKQKDIIIGELREKIKLLYVQIDLMNKCHESRTCFNEGESKNKRTQINGVTKSAPAKTNQIKMPLAEDNSRNVNKPVNEKKDASREQLKTEYRDKLKTTPTEPKATTSGNGPSETVSKNNFNDKPKTDTWTTISKRKNHHNKKPLVGEAGNSEIKSIPKKAFLFVSRLHPKTTNKQLEDYLRPRFPEVCVEVENFSKNPEYYASYKVTVNLENLEKVLQPNQWPRGAYISRFFHRKPRSILPT